MQAAVGCEQLKKFPSFIERRRHNWDRLRKALEGTEDKLILPEPAENSCPSWFGFLISVREDSGLDRNLVTRYIESHNIQTRLLFSGNLIKHPCFDQIRGTDAYRVVGDLTVNGGTIENGTATKNGGNIIIWDGASMFVYGGEIKNGTTGDFGGNVWTQGTFTLNGGTISGGEAKANSGKGYQLYHWNNVLIPTNHIYTYTRIV